MLHLVVWYCMILQVNGHEEGVKLDAHSDNEAEYAALEVGLEMCIRYGFKQL